MIIAAQRGFYILATKYFFNQESLNIMDNTNSFVSENLQTQDDIILFLRSQLFGGVFISKFDIKANKYAVELKNEMIIT